MKLNKLIIACIMISLLQSCHDKPKIYSNPIAQDPNYRIGKWYSISDTTGDSRIGVNSLLDTIWFINDTLAGWTGFVPYQPHEYAFFKTYFSDAGYIVYLAPDAQIPTQIDVISHEYNMQGDTFTIFWDLTTTPPQIERYLKKKN